MNGITLTVLIIELLFVYLFVGRSKQIWTILLLVIILLGFMSLNGWWMVSIVGIFILGLVLQKRNQDSTRERDSIRNSISVQANGFLEKVKNQNGLTPIQSNLITKKGENVFWEEETSLYEVRSVRQYESGSAGFRVFKGFYVGGSKGKSMSNYELTHLDNGTLSITNQRIIFNGQTLDRTITLDKVFSLNRSVKQVEISVENRQKSMIFDVSNPFIFSTVFMICNQVSDPTDLSEIKLDIQFEE